MQCGAQRQHSSCTVFLFRTFAGKWCECESARKWERFHPPPSPASSPYTPATITVHTPPPPPLPPPPPYSKWKQRAEKKPARLCTYAPLSLSPLLFLSLPPPLPPALKFYLPHLSRPPPAWSEAASNTLEPRSNQLEDAV